MTIDEFALFLNHFLHQFPYVPDEVKYITFLIILELEVYKTFSLIGGFFEHQEIDHKCDL
jgi:hypothetical protein